MGGTAMGGIAKYIAVLLVGLVIGFVLGMLAVEKPKETSTVTVTDTIPYYKPVAKDSLVVRYETVKLPAVRDTVRDSLIYKDTLVHDSVNVILPITQKKYEDSTYTAWVSGFRPNLDSINIYRKTVYKTITEKPRRFGIGVMGGYGYGTKGTTPFIGVGIYYRLFNL